MSSPAAIIAANLAAGAIGSAAKLAGRKAVLLYDPEQQPAGLMGLPVIDAVRPGGIVFDAVVTVSHRNRASATRHPVEQGADVSDHTKAEPREVDLADAIVSNFPALVGAPLARSPDQARMAFGVLERWRSAGTPLTLVTDLDVYDTVVIESLDVPRDAARSNSMHAQIHLVEIRTVATVVVQEAKKDRAQPAVNNGAQGKTSPDAATERKGSAMVNLGIDTGMLKPL